MAKGNFTFTGVLVKEDDSYTALCLELDVASQGQTVRGAKNALIEAATLYLESAIESNLPFIRPVPPTEDPRVANLIESVETFPLKVSIAVRAYA